MHVTTTTVWEESGGSLLTEDWPCVLTGAPTGTGVPDHNTGKTKRAQVEGLGGGVWGGKGRNGGETGAGGG